MLACPHMNRNEIAAELGYTAAWLSTVCSSDAFKMRLNARRLDYEGDLNSQATQRLHELDEQATSIIKAELNKSGEEVDPRYALEVKKVVQRNMGLSGNNGPKLADTIVLQRNTQINASVLQRARQKMMKFQGADSELDLFDEVTEGVTA